MTSQRRTIPLEPPLASTRSSAVRPGIGSGLADPATFVIHGLATVRDADLRANSARYLAESSARFPQLFASMPTPVMSRMAFYWARIWIEVIPVRVLWGEEDTWIPAATGERLTAGIRGAAFALVHGAGHLIQLDAPVALATELRSWLTRLHDAAAASTG